MASIPQRETLDIDEQIARIEKTQAELQKIMRETIKLERDTVKVELDTRYAPIMVAMQGVLAGAALAAAVAAFTKLFL